MSVNSLSGGRCKVPRIRVALRSWTRASVNPTLDKASKANRAGLPERLLQSRRQDGSPAEAPAKGLPLDGHVKASAMQVATAPLASRPGGIDEFIPDSHDADQG